MKCSKTTEDGKRAKFSRGDSINVVDENENDFVSTKTVNGGNKGN